MKISLITLLLFSVLAFPTLALCQQADTTKDAKAEEESVATGVVASFGQFKREAAIPAADTTEAAGGTESAIRASVGRSGSGKCTATLSNASSENAYSVSFRVLGYSTKGRQVFSRGFSGTLSPGESLTREVVNCDRDVNLQVELQSARKLGG